jgi:hypothetical protein
VPSPCLVPYNGPVPLYGPHPDLTDGAPALAESALTRRIQALVRALGVVVAGGRPIPAPRTALAQTLPESRYATWIAIAIAALVMVTGFLLVSGAAECASRGSWSRSFVARVICQS